MDTTSEGRAAGLFESAVRDLEEGAAPPPRAGGVTARDLLVLLKLAAAGPERTCAELARELGIAAVEASLGLERCRRVGLVDAEKRRVSKPALLEFFEHGLRFVFPPEFVLSGREAPAAAPLDRAAPAAAARDPRLGELLAHADALRFGGPRERALAARGLARLL